MTTAATIDPKIVKDLRDRTHAGMMDCKKALTEANGNPEEAEKILRKKFNLAAGKKAGRETREGVIASYIHLGGKVGVLVEVNCEKISLPRMSTSANWSKTSPFKSRLPARFM